MTTRITILTVFGLCLLHGVLSSDFETSAAEKIENAIQQLLSPLANSRAKLEEALKKHLDEHSTKIGEHKAIYLRLLRTIPKDCSSEATSIVSKFNAMDLDSCENLTYTIEESHQLVLQGYNYSAELWHDLANVTDDIKQCPNKNPILVARCVIQTLITVRDKINEYKPVLLPYEEKVKHNLVKLGREFADCLNFKTSKVDEVVRTAIQECY